MQCEWTSRYRRFCRALWMLASPVFFLFASGSENSAGELPRHLVMADAKWVFHIDIEALKRTDLYRYLQVNGQAAGIFNLSFPIAKEEFKMDFTRCESLTFYGKMDDDDEAWVGILKMPPAYRKEILNSLEKLAQNEEGPLEKIPEHKSWNGFDYDDEVSIYSPMRNLFIIGEEDSAEKACQIATGKASNPPSTLLEGWDAKIAPFVSMASVRGPDDESPLPEGLDFSSALSDPRLKAYPSIAPAVQAGQWGAIAKSTLFVGETTNWFWLRMALRTTNAASAVELHQTLTNFVALAETLTATNRELQILLQHLKIVPERDAVNISVMHPTLVNGKSIYAGMIDTSPDKTNPNATADGSKPSANPSDPVIPPPGNKKGAP
jgi:hypothetical protein